MPPNLLLGHATDSGAGHGRRLAELRPGGGGVHAWDGLGPLGRASESLGQLQQGSEKVDGADDFGGFKRTAMDWPPLGLRCAMVTRARNLPRCTRARQHIPCVPF